MGMCVLNPSTWTSGEEVCSSDVFQLSRFATSRKEMCIAHTLHCNQRVVQQKERTTWVVLQVVSIICGHPPPRHSMYAIFACTVWGGARGGFNGAACMAHMESYHALPFAETEAPAPLSEGPTLADWRIPSFCPRAPPSCCLASLRTPTNSTSTTSRWSAM